MPEVRLSTVNLVLKLSVTGHIDLKGHNMVEETLSVLKSFGYCFTVFVDSMCLKDPDKAKSQEEFMQEAINLFSEEGKSIYYNNNKKAVNKKQKGMVKLKDFAKIPDDIASDEPVKNICNMSMLTGSKDCPNTGISTNEDKNASVSKTINKKNKEKGILKIKDFAKIPSDIATHEPVKNINNNIRDSNTMLPDLKGSPNRVQVANNDKNIIEIDLTLDDEDNDIEPDSTTLDTVGEENKKLSDEKAEPSGNLMPPVNYFCEVGADGHLSNGDGFEDKNCIESMDVTDKPLLAASDNESTTMPSVKNTSSRTTLNRKSSDINKPKASSNFPLNKLTCLLCNKTQHSYCHLMCHLALRHYDRQLRELWDVDTSVCPICQKEAITSAAKIIHVGVVHKILMSVANEAVRAQLKYLASSEKACKPLKSKWKQRSLLQQCVNNSYKCPTCHSEFDKLAILKNHMARTHYKNSILKTAGFKQNCQVCQKLAYKKSTGTLSHTEVFDVARHLGIVHGHLEHVLPNNVFIPLKEMEETYKTNHGKKQTQSLV